MLIGWETQDIAAVAAAVSATTAMLVAYVGWQQWRLAKAKLRVDLFEKRFAAYESSLNVLRDALRKKGWPTDADVEFQRQIETSKFLFPPSVSEKLIQIRNVIIDMSAASEAVEDVAHEDPERPGFLKQRRESVRHLREEIPRLAQIFAPHMKVPK